MSKDMLVVRKKLYDQGGSLVLILPKIWLDSRGLKAHDIVEIQLNDDLTIKPLDAGRKKQ